MKTKQKGFSLIELLVVIVIIGILATVSISTFSGYFERANNSKRESNVNSVAHIIKVVDATEWDGQIKYYFKDRGGVVDPAGTPIERRKTLQTILEEHDTTFSSLHPDQNGGICYYYGYNLGGDPDPANATPTPTDNEFFVASWRILEGGSTGSVIVDGTEAAVNAVDAVDFQEADFRAVAKECPETSQIYLGGNWNVYEINDNTQD